MTNLRFDHRDLDELVGDAEALDAACAAGDREAARDAARCLLQTAARIIVKGTINAVLDDMLPACAHDWQVFDNQHTAGPVTVCAKCGKLNLKGTDTD